MKEFKAESKKLLDLVVNSIYTNREIFLRELVSNASDAIDKRRFAALTDSSLDCEFAIDIAVDKVNRTLSVTDNGVGMSESELDDNLGVIAASGTEAFKKQSQADKSAGELIGMFGVGFYSAFMVAEKVTVTSRKIGEEQAYCWTSDGINGFDTAKSERADYGTTVTLTLKPDGEDDDYTQFLDEQYLRTLIKRYSDYIRYPIRLKMPTRSAGDDSGAIVEKFELTTLNSMTPVWKKLPSELGENELDEFYMHSFHDYTEPLFNVSSHVEGAVEYRALLFVPQSVPYDYYTKDFKRGLALYCNGVLIMEKCEELLPEYLGFVRGIVDTPDLALNISRETLQNDRRMRAIANGLEKKLLSELSRILKTARDKYEKFFDAFAKSIKYGAYNNYGADKDKLKDLLMYYSDAQKKNVTLKEYTENLKPDDAILYACGASVDKIAMTPQLEGVRSKSRDVLYFVDPVDEFIARMLESYDGHKFQNIGAVQDDGAKVQADADLLERISLTLKGRAAVAATDKLKSYPVCLASKGEISLEMERVMEAMGGAIKAERVLQVNFAHPAVTALKALADDAFADAVTVLYNEALLAEGCKTELDFLPALNRVLSKIGGTAQSLTTVESDSKSVRATPSEKLATKSVKSAKPETTATPKTEKAAAKPAAKSGAKAGEKTDKAVKSSAAAKATGEPASKQDKKEDENA